jgi:hypothetical protein
LETLKNARQASTEIHTEELGECIQDLLKEEWTVLKDDLKYAPPSVKQ